MNKLIAGVTLALGLAVASSPNAATLVQVDFSGTLTSGGVAVRAPFNGASSGITQGMTVLGSFVYDKDLVTGSGLELVSFASLAVDPDSAFQFDIGGLSYNLGDATTGSIGITPAIQFSNGAFNGFNFVSDFAYSDGLDYRLRFNSKNFQIKRVDPVTGFNIGTTVYVQGNLSSTLTNERAYVAPGGPNGAVPEPTTWALMIIGFGGAAAALRSRRKALIA